MKKTTILFLAAMLVAAPALAAAPSAEDAPVTPENLEAAASAVVVEDAVLDASRRAETAAQDMMEDRGTNTGKVILGIALIAGGAGFIANGASLWQDEPDVFGRKKNLDSYSLYGLGGATAVVGALVLRSGLRGEGW